MTNLPNITRSTRLLVEISTELAAPGVDSHPTSYRAVFSSTPTGKSLTPRGAVKYITEETRKGANYRVWHGDQPVTVSVSDLRRILPGELEHRGEDELEIIRTSSGLSVKPAY